MKYIEIKEGLSICIDSIVVIENVASESSYTGFKTIVHTKVGVFESSFPYETLLDLINSQEDEEYDLQDNNDVLNNNLELLNSKVDILVNSQQKWVG